MFINAFANVATSGFPLVDLDFSSEIIVKTVRNREEEILLDHRIVKRKIKGHHHPYCAWCESSSSSSTSRTIVAC